MSQQTLDAPEKKRAEISARTLRKDRWWLAPATTFAIFTIWVTYATVRGLWGGAYWVGEYHYLTPFYSPCVSDGCVEGSSHFGTFIPELPGWMFFVPFAALSLPFLLLFRLSCYYYRKAYYRSFWATPAACAVPDKSPVRKTPGAYTGETKWPLIWQNIHRYTFYAAILVSLVNTYDAILAFHGKDGGFGIGLGTLIIWVNLVLLWLYTLSCHSCRHLTGGRLKHFSKHPVRYWLWTQVSKLNEKHMQLALITLGTLMLTDGYIALIASDTISDLRFIN